MFQDDIFSKIKINHSGQSLVELIVAIAVIQIGLLGVWSLFLVNFNTEREADLRIVGVNLAREGVEVVRNIRDSNWLKRKLNEKDTGGNIIAWDSGLSAGEYSASFDSQELEPFSDKPLVFDSNNYYVDLMPSGQQTQFTRRIILKDICCDDADNNLVCDNLVYYTGSNCNLKIGVNVVAEVSWSISGQSRRAIIEDNLYDWQ